MLANYYSEEEHRDILPAQLAWLILSNLDKFNDKPSYIFRLNERVQYLHKLSPQRRAIYFNGAVEYYENSKKFPDMAYLKHLAGNSHTVEFVNEQFSISIYEAYSNYIEMRIAQEEVKRDFVESKQPNLEDCREVIKKLNKYLSRNSVIEENSKNKILNMYKKRKDNFRGVYTYIDIIDRTVGMLGCNSLAVFGAPSGEGKSTFALMTAYNNAVYGGKCVDFITFEFLQDYYWFNLACIESYILGYNLKSELVHSVALTEEEENIYNICIESLLNKLNESGGYIHIIDQSNTKLDSYESLCANLESTAEKRNRAADLIVIDNVDGFKIFDSNTKNIDEKVNNIILSLDSYCKTYYNNTGTTILLLTQLTDEFIKRQNNPTEDKKGRVKKITIDYTCFHTYKTLYQRSRVALVGLANSKMKSINRMNIFVVKKSIGAPSLEPIKVAAYFPYGYIGGEPSTVSESMLEDFIKKNKKINSTNEVSSNEGNTNIDNTNSINEDNIFEE
jgi:replicative DNA helicase